MAAVHHREAVLDGSPGPGGEVFGGVFGVIDLENDVLDQEEDHFERGLPGPVGGPDAVAERVGQGPDAVVLAILRPLADLLLGFDQLVGQVAVELIEFRSDQGPVIGKVGV